ncbi:MAG: phage portal protein [Clostridia bacterium]|nr:phage portal protein [Clostridia bacterium]
MAIQSQIIKELITNFNMSEIKRKMLEGERYFRNQNDILKKDLKSYKIYDKNTGNIVTKTNENKSDQHLPHGFYPKQVNQKKAYVCSKPITITYISPVNEDKDETTKKAEKKITNMIWNILGTNFEKLIKNRLKEASNKGRSWVHPDYIEGKFVLKKLPSEECIPIYDNETQTYLIAFIHFYTIQDLTGEKPKDRIYVEYWDKNEVRYYIETKVGDTTVYLEDVTRPRPECHWYREIYDNALNNLKKVEKHSWGRVPFIEIENNEEKMTDLEPIKPLIDAYDLIDSNFVNTIEDLKEIIWLINGYGAEDLLQLIENLKVNGVARTNDTTGKIDAKLLPIPYEARQALLKGLKELIYEFGRAVDTSNKDLIGQAPSGVSLEFLYTDLDMKADDTIGGLRSAIYEILWYVLQDLKMQGKIPLEINEFDFKIEFNKSRIFNETEKVNTLSNDTTISIKTKLENHPYVDDVDTELQRLKEEKAENMKMQSQIFNSSGGFEDNHNHNKDDDTE